MHWKELDNAYRASDSDKLLKMCEIELKSNPKSLYGRYYKALGLRKTNQLLESVAILDEIVRENPQEADFWSERAVSFLHLNNAQKALDDFNMALSLDPNNGYRYSSRAFAKAYFKDVEGAMADYKKALEIDPEDAASLNNLGLLEEQRGRKDKAQSLYAKADEKAGVKHTNQEQFDKIAKEYREQEAQNELDEKPKLTISFYLKTAKELLFTKAGRKEFLNFFKGKLTKKQ